MTSSSPIVESCGLASTLIDNDDHPKYCKIVNATISQSAGGNRQGEILRKDSLMSCSGKVDLTVIHPSQCGISPRNITESPELCRS